VAAALEPGWGTRTAREFNATFYREMVAAHLRKGRYCGCGDFPTYASVFEYCRAHDALRLPNVRSWDGEPLLPEIAP